MSHLLWWWWRTCCGSCTWTGFHTYGYPIGFEVCKLNGLLMSETLILVARDLAVSFRLLPTGQKRNEHLILTMVELQGYRVWVICQTKNGKKSRLLYRFPRKGHLEHLMSAWILRSDLGVACRILRFKIESNTSPEKKVKWRVTICNCILKTWNILWYVHGIKITSPNLKKSTL